MHTENYTSIPDRLFNPTMHRNHKGVYQFIMKCIIAVASGAALTILFYIGILTMNGNQLLTYKSKAAEIQNNRELNGYSCLINNIIPPNQITATTLVNNIETEVKNGDTLNNKNPITFTWNSVPDAVGYYVALSSGSAQFIDPVETGTRVFTPQITFSSLKPNSHYGFFLRSISKAGTITLIYPTPYDCYIYVPAVSQFEVNTK